jgi:hypothetical protein
MNSGANASQTIMMRTTQECTCNVFPSQDCLDDRLMNRIVPILLPHWSEKGVQNLNASMQKWRQRYLGPNELPHFRALIDGLGIHFIHQRGKGERPMPLVLLHGWPATFLQMQRIFPILGDPESHGEDGVILPDAFDIIVPSLPGHGF